jgi:hypothetical protein
MLQRFDQNNARIPNTVLDLRDVIVVMVAVVSVSGAFFMYDTRIAVLEADQRYAKSAMVEYDSVGVDIAEVKSQLREMAALSISNKQLLDNIQLINRDLDKLTGVHGDRIQSNRDELNIIKTRIRDLEKSIR